MTKILLVEDEESFSDALSFMLQKEGFEVVTADDGNTALELFTRENVDLILLDVMLPGRSGIEVCTEIRKTSTVPIVMVSAKDGEIDRVLGLEIGADDYVTKPFSSRELIARIRAVLRRQNGGGELDEPENLLVAGPLRMDVDRHEVTVNSEPVNLPLREFELLELFMRNPGRVLTRAQLIDRIWGSDYVGDTKTLDVHVKRIRGKIEEDPAEPRFIVTLRGLGYKLDL